MIGIGGWLQNVVENSPYSPHITCYLYDWSLVALNVVGDLLITIAYFVIPAFLIYLAKRFPAQPGKKVLWLFGTFIVGCGATHLMEIWNIWFSNYWIAGWIKMITALISLFTAYVLWKSLPTMMGRANFFFKDVPKIMESNQGLTAIHETTKIALKALSIQAKEATESLIKRGYYYDEHGPMARLKESIDNINESFEQKNGKP